MSDKFISVLMATFNGESFLEKQLNSILNQTHSNFELIICDDASKDTTTDILNNFGLLDERITVFVNEKNLGFKKNFENLMSLAKYDLLAFSDQDDIWHEMHLEVLLNNLGNNDLVCGNSVFIDQYDNLLEQPVRSDNCKIVAENKKDLILHLCHSNFIQGAALMVRKNLVDAITPIPEEVIFHDYWIGINAAIRNGVAYTSQNILLYRNHGANATSLNKETLFYRIFKIRVDYASKISFLNNVIEYNKTKPVYDLCLLQEALCYYENLQKRNNWFLTLKYFLNNYENIYLTSSKKFFRFFKVFVFKY